MPTEISRAELKYLVERQREEIRAINEVGRIIASSTEPEEIVGGVASYLNRTFSLALCGVLLLEQRFLLGIQFVKIASVDAAAAIREFFATPIEGFPQPLKEESFSKRLDDRSSGPSPWARAGGGYLRSRHGATLTFNDKPIGRLAVFSAKADAFSKEDRHVIDIVANQLAAALHNALLVDKLQRTDRMKNELLAVLSHELKTPLTVIQEASSLLLEGTLGSLSVEQSDFLRTAQKNGLRLQGIIEEVELAAQLITGKIPYRFEETNLEKLLKELEATWRPLAEARGVELSFTRSGRPFCLADPRCLSQALGQLVENAIQACSEQEKVSLAVSETPEGPEIQITDGGKGIPDEELPNLFERFHSVGGINDRKTGGLGLGLFLAQRIVAGHGGEISVESQAGQGTQVRIRLPRNPKSPA